LGPFLAWIQSSELLLVGALIFYMKGASAKVIFWLRKDQSWAVEDAFHGSIQD
jgi:hypothetical protein